MNAHISKFWSKQCTRKHNTFTK